MTMKDVVSHSSGPDGGGPQGLGPAQPLAHGCSLLQPCLDPLPPYILAEAQLRSQRYGQPQSWGAPAGTFWAPAPTGQVPSI